AAGLGNEASFVQKLVALEGQVLIPLPPFEPERDRRPLLARGLVASALRPAAQFARDRILDQGRRAATMVLPRKIVVPPSPGGLRSDRSFLADEAEIADRNRVRVRRLIAPVGIRERVELLDVTKRMAGLPLDPRAQSRLERAMSNLERPRRQRAPVIDRHG